MLTEVAKGAVYLVDDDIGVQRAVSALLTAADYRVRGFTSAEAFLEKVDALPRANAVLLLDVCMPGIQGLDLQERLNERRIRLPVVVMTAHGDIQMAVRAMRNGAVDFLEKPFTVDEIEDALERALAAQSAPAAPQQRNVVGDLAEKFESLTPREREVLSEIVNGATSKEIARTLDVSPRTVDVHRQKIMQKMTAGNVAELVRMTVMLELGA